MSATQLEKQLYGSQVKIVCRDNNCTIYKIADKTGEAIMTSYHVFPGIELVYNDVRMSNFRIDTPPPDHIIEINHCKKGRIECQLRNEYIYLSEGDLSIHIKDSECKGSYFPLNHYYGISIAIDMEKAPKFLSQIFDDVTVDIATLVDRFCAKLECTVLRGEPCFKHIFFELYSIPENIKKGYLKLKVLELLLFLFGMDLSNAQMAPIYIFRKSQVDTVKAVKQYLTEHPEEHITVQALSERFGMSQTALKSCFKGVFGQPVYAFTRHLKMQKAALLLRETDKTVIEIAGMLGYDNGSKFARAFRDIMGVSPKDYRKLPN